MRKPIEKPIIAAPPRKPEPEDVLAVFRRVLGTRWRDPCEARVRLTLTHICRLLAMAGAGVDDFILADPAREALAALRTLLATLPGFIASAQAAAEQGRAHGLPSQGDWLAWRGKELLGALEPWRQPLGAMMRPDRRRHWHWYARALAREAAEVVRAEGVDDVGFANAAGRGVKIVQGLLAIVGISPEAEAIAKSLRDRAEN